MPMNRREEAIVYAAMNGNASCFEELYKLYYEKVYALAKTIVKNDEDAEDILQMTFVKAWENIYTLNDPAAFNTWIQRITVNLCYSMMRKSRPAYSIDDEGYEGEVMQIEDDVLLPEQYAEREDLSVRLRAVIDNLSDVQRETILLYYFNEMSVSEIAQVMDCSEGTVKSRLYLARKAIRAEIEEQERISGQRFYSVVPIPFAAWYAYQVRSAGISAQVAAAVYGKVSGVMYSVPQSQVYGVYNGAQHVASGAPRHAAAGAVKGAAGKSSVSLGTKIVAGVVAAGVLTGGGVFAAYMLNKPDDPSPAAVGEAVGQPDDPLLAAAVGDEILFGRYEQDADTANGPEPITWRVLEKEGDKLFVVSEYALDSLSYEAYSPGENWSEAGLSDYLNGDFYNIAFNADEQRCIPDTYILCDEGHDRELPQTYVMDKPSLSSPVDTRRDTVAADKVFILSDYEVVTYFPSEDAAAASATAYAVSRGVDADEDGSAAWWLRSHTTSEDICIVDKGGHADIDSGGSVSDVYALRPAVWIDVNAYKNGQSAGSVVQPVDTRYLNESLSRFLKSFNYRSFRNGDNKDNEFDSEKQDDTNILYDILKWFPCVNYYVYYEDLNAGNWKSASQEPSPFEEINNSVSSIYVELDAAKIDDIAKSIFQCTDADIERMRISFPNNTGNQVCAYSDGVYYATRDQGEYLYDPCYYHPIAAEYRDGFYYFTLDQYRDDINMPVEVTIGETVPDKRYYVKTSLLPHEGNPWWSLYYYSETPFDDTALSNVAETAADTPEPASFADIAGKYIYTPGSNFGTELMLESDGSFTGYYSDSNYSVTGEDFDMALNYCSFSGAFTNLKKTGENTYTFELQNLRYDKEAGTSEIRKGTEKRVLYLYTDPVGLGMDDTHFTCYTWDTKLSDVPEKLSEWIDRVKQINSEPLSDKLDHNCFYQSSRQCYWYKRE